MTRFVAPAVIAVSLAAAGGVLAETHPHVALPDTVTPEHYRVEIRPDAKALTFQGKVAIDVVVHAPTSTVTLNAADLVIDSAALTGEPGAPKIAYDPAQQTASFDFGHALRPGAYTLTLAYHGKIYQQPSGLFALDYVGAHGQERALFTQFESADERRFVPSWDQPDRKATFQLTAVVPRDQMAVGNMPVASRTDLPGGLSRVTFQTTPKMSSYLLFFGLGDFERVHRMVDGVDVGVIVKRGDAERARYALDAEAQILPWYNAYFGTPFPLPKLDLVAGPGTSTFFGAMENWGAIFSFESELLVDPALSTQADRERVYVVTAHEMAHQWFGDLVTMAWWEDLWLNEGFASWMEDKVTDHFHPEWKMWLKSLGSKQGAMQVDARDGTHPIITPIEDILQAGGAFDAITYSKGEAVIRMLEAYVGEDAWRAGVRRYMHDHAYGNTVTDDLWSEIDRGSAMPLTRIAHDFTLQAGIPLIGEGSADCQGGATRVDLSQSHFAIDADSTSATLWHVPVAAQVLGGPVAKAQVAGAAPQSLTLAGCGPVIINAGQTGYFRSQYPAPALAQITARYGQLSAEDQLGVLNDTATLANAGREPMAAFLDLVEATKSFAPDPVVESAIAGRLAGLDDAYRGQPGQSAFRAWARGALRPAFDRLGWTARAGESENDALLRTAVLTALGQLDDPAVLAEARRRFAGFLADPSSLDPTTRRTVLEIVASKADAATWEQLHQLARNAKTQLEKTQDYQLLASAEDPALARKALGVAISGEVSPTTTPLIFGVVAGQHPELVFDFIAPHWAQFSQGLEPDTRAAAMPRIASSSYDPAMIAKLDAFAQANIPANARQDVRKAEAQIRYQAQIRTQRLPEIDRWLAAR